MVILSAEASISTSTPPISKHRFKEIGEATTMPGKFLSIRRIPISSVTIRTISCTRTATKTTKATCACFLTGTLLCFKFIGMLPMFTVLIVLLTFLRVT